jgi:protein-tyrosine phosphatase
MVIQSQTRLRKDDLSSVITQLLLYSLDGSARTTVDDSELRKDEAMTVWHYHFDAWPDHGVPEGGAVDALRRLILEIARRREELGDCEVWVHWYVAPRFAICPSSVFEQGWYVRGSSAGVGRTGAFIALSSLLGPPPTNPIPQSPLGQSPLGPLPAELRHDAVAQTIDGIREWRGMLVQNQDQMRLVYDMAKV